MVCLHAKILNSRHIGDKENEMSTEAKVVKPAIYQFAFSDSSKEGDETKWGWHNAKELVDAFNNILNFDGKESMTTAEICRKYTSVNLLVGVDAPPWLWKTGKWSPTVDKYGQLCRMSDQCNFEPGADWLATLVENNGYIPAGLGGKLLSRVEYTWIVDPETEANMPKDTPSDSGAQIT